MIVVLIILTALVIVGGILYLLHKRDERLNNGQGQPPTLPPIADMPAGGEDDESPCCGMHLTCEKDSLVADATQPIEYFDDEELDRFKGTPADGYTNEAIEEFRDILLTLLPTDIAPWARSLQVRGIELPTPVREELLMIVSEARAAKTYASEES